jgi:hypothetical protein
MDQRIYGPRLTSGYTLGATSNVDLGMRPALTDYRSARPVSADKQQRLYKANPTLAENGGAGPSRWSTTNSTLGAPHPDKPSVYHFRRPASAPATKQKVLPYEQGSGPTLNNKFVPPTAGGPAGLRESEMVYDYSASVDRRVQRRVEQRLRREDPLGFHQHRAQGTERNTSTSHLFMRHTAASRLKMENRLAPAPRLQSFDGSRFSRPQTAGSNRTVGEQAPSLTAGFRR